MRIVLIAEKPSVARTYAMALNLENEEKKDGYIEGHSKWDGNDYYITWSIGHLVTLSMPEKYDEKYKKWNLDDLPFLPNTYKYEVIKDVSKQFNVVKSLYNNPNVDRIIYGGDSGREGAYIQALIKMVAKNNGHVSEMMLWIDSQTTEEIRRGLSNMKPFNYYQNLIMAGYMRAIEDYAFGLNYSRALTKKFGAYFNNKIASNNYKSINVGRVMTCVLGMIVEREEAIKNFVEKEFYKIYANCSNGEFEFSVDWLIDENSKYHNSPLLFDNKGFEKEEDAKTFLEELNSSPKLVIDSVTDKIEKKKAPLLFNLAELQNECSKRFKISPNKTLEVAQKLYDLKLTTYPRTDARYLSTAICKEINKNLEGLNKSEYANKFVKQILDFKLYSDIAKSTYCNDSKITDHYAIIPTGLVNTSELDELELNVYHMIVDRFLSIFLPNAEYNISTAILLAKNGEKFRITEKTLIKTGFLELLKGKTEDEETIEGVKLSDYIKKGEVFNASFESETGKTTPPKRYTSGSMILAMENAGTLIEDEELRAQIKGSGIGTSATRGGILEKLSNPKVGYISINKKTQVVTPTPDGYIVYDIVKKTIPQFLSPKMTASWEKGLSKIEEGTTTREEYTRILENEVRKTIQHIKNLEDFKYEGFTPTNTNLKCPFCDGDIITTPNGYKCTNNVYKKSDACTFFIGQNISTEELCNLVTNGRTNVIDSLKKKDGKTFSATLILNKKEKKVDLEFNNNSSDTNLKCPFCKGKIISTNYGFKCENNKYKEENSCPFFVGKIAGKFLTLNNLEQLISYGKTEVIKGFKKKSGENFSAPLKINIEEKKIEFDFLPKN